MCTQTASRKLVLAIDQSTQGTKAVLFDALGAVVGKVSRLHDQLVSEAGWVSHDAEQIMTNVLAVARDVCKHANVRQGEVCAVGISNQRETCVAWDREVREPLAPAIVWQCGRAQKLCSELAQNDPHMTSRIRKLSGLELSPYFSAAKMAWLLRNVPEVRKAAEARTLALGTIDAWLIFKLSEEHTFATEPSNACRTQLMNLNTAQWDDELCDFFAIPQSALPQIYSSDAVFGHTTMGGLFQEAVPICGVLGDSQAALAAQNCLAVGDLKVTYGTGSSVMMQVGEKPVSSRHGLVSSIAWEIAGKRSYVLEGNLNYTGAVISWLKDKMHLIGDPIEVESLIAQANPTDRTYFVPAFTGLGAPWWDAKATGLLTGITRTTGRAEMVKACAESIPFQIADVIEALEGDTNRKIREIRVDGGVTQNKYLMQLQADITGSSVAISSLAELSAAGAAYLAGVSVNMYQRNVIYEGLSQTRLIPMMASSEKKKRLCEWHRALQQARGA